MRQFRLINGNGETFDLMREDAFFHAPGGLGFDREIESMMAGYEFVELRDDLAQKQITGEMVFLGYEQYKEFISFIGVKPLRLEYKPLNQWHRIRVKVQRIGKTEISRVGRLICPIDFLAFSTWYNVLNYETVPEEEPVFENLMVRGNAIHIVEDDDDSYTIGASTDADDVVKRFLSGDLATTENTVPVQLPGFTGDTYQLTAGDYFFKAIGKRQGVRSYFKVKPLVKTASGNPIQIQDAIEVAPNSLEVSVSPKQDGTPWINSTQDTDPYTFRSMPSGASGGNREYDKLVGGSVVWNQRVQQYTTATKSGVTLTNNGSGVLTASGTSTAGDNHIFLSGTSLIKGHKYLVPLGTLMASGGSAFIYLYCYSLSTLVYSCDIRASHAEFEIYTPDQDFTNVNYYLNIAGANRTFSGQIAPMLTDLTTEFGTTIADYVYSLEQNTAGSGISWLKSYGFFTKQYYAYSLPTIQSVSVSEKVTTGINQWDEDWEAGGINTSTGADQPSSASIRSKNFIRLDRSLTYYISVPSSVFNNNQMFIYFYDENKSFVSASLFNAANGWAERLLKPTRQPIGVFIRIVVGYGTTYNHDICINISDPSINGTYYPYTSNTYSLSTTELRGIPSLVDGQLVYDGDEYSSSGTVTRKYAVVDLGTLNWTADSNRPGAFYAWTLYEMCKTGGGLICPQYVWRNAGVPAPSDLSTADKTISAQPSYGGGYIFVIDTSHASDTGTDFKAAMSGVLLVFELETANTYAQAELSNLTWNVGSSYPHTFYAKLNGAKKYPINTTPSIVTTTSKYTIVGTRGTASYSDLQMSQGVNDDYIYIRDDSIADTSALVTALSGEYLFYQLESTSTKESTTPFTNPQVIDEHGTESYTDYPVSQGTRDVAIPVGHKSNYALSVPVVGADEVSVNVSGSKNLFGHISTAITVSGVTYTWNADGTLTANGTSSGETGANNSAWKNGGYVTLLKGTYKVVRNNPTVDTGKSQNGWYLYDYDSGERITAITNTVQTFTLAEDTKVYLSCYQYNAGYTNASVEILVCHDTETDTNYTPFVGNTTYTHSLSPTMYGGTVEMVGGVETTEMAEVDLSTLTWTYSANRNGYFYTLLTGMKPNETLYCNAYPFIGIRPSTYSTDKVLALETASDLYIDIHDTSYDNATDFSASLSGVKLIYTLATPTTSQGAGSAVELLKGDNVLSTDGDDIDLSYDAYPDSRLVLDVYGELAPDPDSAADTQIVSNFTVYDDQEVQFYMDQEDIPFDYSVEAFLAAGSYPANKVYGYPYPYSYSGSVNGEMDVFNGSTVAGYCRLTIQGPVEDPIWAVYQNGNLLQRGKITATIPEGHVLVVDSSPTELEISERTLDGELVANRYADSDFSTVRFITIPPGSSKVVVTQTGDEPITAFLEVDELAPTV